jgi:hypothetical protein
LVKGLGLSSKVILWTMQVDQGTALRYHLQRNKVYTEPLWKQFQEHEISVASLRHFEPEELCNYVNLDVEAARKLIEAAKATPLSFDVIPKQPSHAPTQASRPAPSNVTASSHTQQAKMRGAKRGPLPSGAANKAPIERKMFEPRRAPSDPQVRSCISTMRARWESALFGKCMHLQTTQPWKASPVSPARPAQPIVTSKTYWPTAEEFADPLKCVESQHCLLRSAPHLRIRLRIHGRNAARAFIRRIRVHVVLTWILQGRPHFCFGVISVAIAL